MALPPSRRTASLTGSARLSLSVGKSNAGPPTSGPARHPLKHDWSISYVHRPPGTKVEYEKEIRKVATFGSIESFFHLYSHLTPPDELPPVTDVLVFVSRIGRPGVWEEMRDGGKFTLRLVHPITPLLFESLLLALIGDQFDEADCVVGCVLSVRQAEDILSVWVEEEGEGVRSGALREKILTLLSLPSTTMCEYRSNRALLDAASTVKAFQENGIGDQAVHVSAQAQGQNQSQGQGHHSGRSYHHGRQGHEGGHGHGGYSSSPGGLGQAHPHGHGHDRERGERVERGERGERSERERVERSERTWGQHRERGEGYRKEGGERNGWGGRNGWVQRQTE